MRIAIASGKGGTGKTTVSVNLALTIGSGLILADCDVEEPNCHLFVGGDQISEKTVSIKVPSVDESLCDGCGECGRFCQYKAITSFGAAPLLFPEMCHGCGGCAMVCPRKAITEVDRRIGVVITSKAGDLTLVHGRMDVGVAMAPPLIRAVKDAIPIGAAAILDAPPGTSCPVIAAMRGCDAVVLVTEPTPFGLNDLSLAVDVVRELSIPFGVVVNRHGAGDDRVREYCLREKIDLIAEIPDDRRIAEVYSRGGRIVDELPEYREVFGRLWGRIQKLN